MNLSKFLGSLLLIIGTSIGGGMLALPVATADGGFYYSLFAFIFAWFIMTSGAFLILEVLQPMPKGTNMISLSRHYLGAKGEVAVWFFYLALLYTLLGAYISGGTDVLANMLSEFSLHIPLTIVAILYTLTFSLIVYRGIRSVDLMNRALMFAKLGTYILLIAIILPHVHITHFQETSLSKLLPKISILITSFGFASIVPSLRDYWDNDIQSLKKIIFWGSLIPLICYLLWNFVIMGAIGQAPLAALLHATQATSGIGKALIAKTHSTYILRLFDFFSCICMLTAFISVSLGLFDFLADGFRLNKKGKQGFIVLALTFLPPLLIVIVNPDIYLSALNYAGILCIILLLIVPVLMGWCYRRQKNRHIILKGQKPLLIMLLLSGLFCMLIPYVLKS
ncbi:MAG: amino acid permease [Gammaproteobacteria bacterium]|nr:amino acid permease [Gammaproteobacteria bacterium]